MEKEKIIYLDNVIFSNGDDDLGMVKPHNILVEVIDGPFKSTYEIGYIELYYDKTKGLCVLQTVEIKDEYKELDVFGNILDMSCDIASVSGYKSFIMRTNDEEHSRILTNKGFKLDKVMSDDPLDIRYIKDIRNVLS